MVLFLAYLKRMRKMACYYVQVITSGEDVPLIFSRDIRSFQI